MLAPGTGGREPPRPGCVRRVAALLLLPALLAGPLAAQRIRVEDVATQRGQAVRVLSIQPAERPAGAVILVPGGHGNLGLTPSGRFARGEGDPLIRARLMFARAGFIAMVADVAPDLKLGHGMASGYRWSARHAEDLGALVRRFRAFAAPVYLIGADRGALSVANAASRLTGPARPDGLVIVSGLLVDTGHDQASVERNVTGLERMTQPVLLVAHPADGCRLTPPAGLERFRPLLPRAARVEALTLPGRQAGRGDPCAASTAHGFLGGEQQLVAQVVSWLKALPHP